MVGVSGDDRREGQSARSLYGTDRSLSAYEVHQEAFPLSIFPSPLPDALLLLLDDKVTVSTMCHAQRFQVDKLSSIALPL
jgi:hypothetical protein